jgi:hypothetical protein
MDEFPHGALTDHQGTERVAIACIARFFKAFDTTINNMLSHFLSLIQRDGLEERKKRKVRRRARPQPK